MSEVLILSLVLHFLILVRQELLIFAPPCLLDSSPQRRPLPTPPVSPSSWWMVPVRMLSILCQLSWGQQHNYTQNSRWGFDWGQDTVFLLVPNIFLNVPRTASTFILSFVFKRVYSVVHFPYVRKKWFLPGPFPWYRWELNIITV